MRSMTTDPMDAECQRLTQDLNDHRAMLTAIRDQLYRWAQQSERGGWSTHQVQPMRDKAGEIGAFLATH